MVGKQGVNLGGRTAKGSYTGGRAGAGGMSGRRGRSAGVGGGRRAASGARGFIQAGIRRGLPNVAGISSNVKAGMGIQPMFRPGVKLGITTKFRLNDPYWTRRIGQARAAGMRAQGALLRVYARNSIRYRKTMIDTAWGRQFRPSTPPRPPFSHTRHPVASLRNIQYDYSPTTDSLIVGAVYLRRTYNTTVPSVHEHAKSVMVQKTISLPPAFGAPRGRGNVNRQRGSNQAWRRMKKQGHPRVAQYQAEYGGRTRIRKKLPPEPLHYPPRPFMLPALVKARQNGKLMQIFSKAFNRRFR